MVTGVADGHTRVRINLFEIELYPLALEHNGKLAMTIIV
jgi:hypothetical protein